MSGINLDSINSYIALAAVLINFTFALLALARTSRETVYISFAMICLGVAWWNFCDFMVYASGSPIWKPVGMGATTVWKNLVSIGAGIAVAALFHFTMALVNRQKSARPYIVLAYALAISIGMVPTGALLSEAFDRFWAGPGWNLTFFAFLFPFIAASIITITKTYQRSGDSEQRGWLIFILAAMVIQVAAGLTDLFHKLWPSLPPLGHLGSTVGPSILAAGVYRYRKTFDILAQAQRKLESLSETAAQIAHEVKNPLTAIKGILALQASAYGSADPGDSVKYNDILVEEVGRIENILENLQDLTKPIVPDIQMTDINDVLKKTIQLAQFRETWISIDLDLQKDLPHIDADPSLLKQVFINLILNASEACDGAGSLVIGTLADRHQVSIIFSDNGPGISENIRSRLFEPFFTTKDTGLGLGLVITGRIVESHKGRLTIDNNETGGAEVTVTLPR